jgi:hypothetical protein
VKNLAASFASGIRRKNDKERMLVTVNVDDYELSVQYTAERLKEWHSQGRVARAYTADELKAAYKKTTYQYVNKIEAAPPLIWSPKAKKQPQLERGQHRRKPLLQYYEANGDHSTSFTPEGAKVSEQMPIVETNNCSSSLTIV